MNDPILDDAARVIEAFGGIRPMAKKLGVAVTTIQGWKERNAIPVQRLDQVREAARLEGIDLFAPGGADPAAESDPERKKDSGGASGASSRTSAASAAGGASRKVRAEKVSGAASGVKESDTSKKRGPTLSQTAGRSDGRGRAFSFGAGFAVVLIAGAAAGWFLRDAWLGDDADGQQTAFLEKRLAASEKAISDAAAGARTATARAETLAAQLDSVADRVARLQESMPVDGRKAFALLQNDFKKLRADLDTLGKTLKVVSNETLAAEVTKLQAAVAELQGAASSDPGTGGDGAILAVPSAQTQAAIRKLSERVADLSATVAALPGDDAARQSARSIAGLGTRIAAVESQLKTIEAGAREQVGTIVALGQLRNMAVSGRAYDSALSVARKMAGSNVAVAGILRDLAPAAKTGAPTLPVLRGEFDALSSDLIAAAANTQGDGWVDQVWNKVKSTVVVRRTGRDVKGDSPPALVAQAEVTLADGDLAAALALVRKLPALAQKAAAGWLARADRRAAIDAALARLDTLIPSLSGELGKSR